MNVKTFFSLTNRLATPVVINVAKDGANIVAKTEGKIVGHSDHGVLLKMKDILYVPDLRDNLLSVRKLAAAGVEVLFVQKKTVLKKDGAVIATAQMKGNLYELDIEVSDSVVNVCQVDQTELWHHRLDTLVKELWPILCRRIWQPRWILSLVNYDSAMRVLKESSVETPSTEHVTERRDPSGGFILMCAVRSIRLSGMGRGISCLSSTTRRTSQWFTS